MLDRLSFGFNRLELALANLSLLVLVVVLAAQVFFRYVLGVGLAWSEEISRFAFVWFVYVSASLAAQKGTHIRVTLATKWVPGGRKVSLLLADAIWVVFNGFVVAAGILLLQRMFKYPSYSTSLFVPLAYIYAIIPAAHALMILRIVQRQVAAWWHGIPLVAGEGDDL
ncbi:MAG: TRAP transporter small permease [Antarcticimicrobium sp.]|uniref:TRAP transporter small permease n=1 Tax=Antarcticimicrobium sp. TaxID=2824147 RepID=UPI002638ED9D|nr:TRAP transporter small permease [Antarcticimicrobium sp.]MDF1717112.1 TRAP transporter small permease [Antarcticimicrobium sp.]